MIAASVRSRGELAMCQRCSKLLGDDDRVALIERAARDLARRVDLTAVAKLSAADGQAF